MENPYTPPATREELPRQAPPRPSRVAVGFLSGFALPLLSVYLLTYAAYSGVGRVTFGLEDLPDPQGWARLAINGALCGAFAWWFRSVPLWVVGLSGLVIPAVAVVGMAIFELWQASA